MDQRRSSVFWGVVLLLAGAFLLLIATDVLSEVTALTWAAICAAGALVLFTGYLIAGWRNWSLLFPATILAVAATLLWLIGNGETYAKAGLSLLIVSTPLWGDYLLKNMIAGNVFSFLIPLAFASPFLVTFLFDRRQWWSLIPAYVLIVIGFILFFAGDNGELLPIMIMFALAVPFVVFFVRDPRQWWALMTAGVLVSACFATIVATSNLKEVDIERFAGAVALAGLSLTFGVLWWQRKLHQTDWFDIPALILGLGALAIFIFGLRFEIFWALAFIAFGGWLLFRSIRPQTVSH